MSQFGFDINYFMDNNNQNLSLSAYPQQEIDTPKKRGRKKKTAPDGTEYVQAEQVQSTAPLSHAQTNDPYMDTYEDTNRLITNTIVDIDELYGTVRQEIETIRNSKTVRNKYNSMGTLAGTNSALLSTKLAAIKELNKVKTDVHNLELKRLSSSMAAAAGQQDDNKILTDMYNALVQTPIGPGVNPFGMPSSQDITLGAGTGIVRSSLDNSDMGYSQFINNPNAEQATVMASNNPNIKTVVVYDEYAPVGQNVRFDVVDMSTGQSVPNIPRPDSMFLSDIKLEHDIGLAVNNNLNTEYTIIYANGGGPTNDSLLNQY